MSNLFEWDELNLLRQEAKRMMTGNRKPKREEIDRFCDYMEFVLCLVVMYGWQDAEEIVGPIPFRDGFDDKTVNLEIAHKTFRDRVEEQLTDGTYDGLLRIIDTEAHRDYNAAIYQAGVDSGIPDLKKKWGTMKDDRVRDSHSYLDGQTVGIDDYFYTYTGAMALHPGGFGEPDEDCNCRCYITLQI